MANSSEVIHKVIAPRPFSYSVKIDTTARGYVQPSVTVNSDSKEIWIEATKLFDQLIDELKVMGLRLVTDIKDEPIKKGKANNDNGE